MPKLKNVEYEDTFLHEIVEENGEKKKKNLVFPVTRYPNILNRPTVTDNIRDSKNPEFLLVSTGEEEVDDNEIYDLFGCEW